MFEKLYVVVRADLDPGAQLAQSGHAISAFACAHPDQHRAWHEGSNNLVICSIADEGALERLLAKAACRLVDRASFHEPDFGGQLTAIAMIGDVARRLTSNLPLALRAPRAA